MKLPSMCLCSSCFFCFSFFFFGELQCVDVKCNRKSDGPSRIRCHSQLKCGRGASASDWTGRRRGGAEEMGSQLGGVEGGGSSLVNGEAQIPRAWINLMFDSHLLDYNWRGDEKLTEKKVHKKRWKRATTQWDLWGGRRITRTCHVILERLMAADNVYIKQLVTLLCNSNKCVEINYLSGQRDLIITNKKTKEQNNNLVLKKDLTTEVCFRVEQTTNPDPLSGHM